LQLTIEKMIYGGDGLARMPADAHGPGKAVFVPFVLPGEQVEVSVLEEKTSFARARLEKILAPLPARVDPACPYFQRCGGCHYQHAGYEHQLALKSEILKENLRRIAKLELGSELHLHPSPSWHYRNRARLRVRCGSEFAIGYYKFASHELLPIEQCPISSPLINRAIAAVWKLGRSGLCPSALEEIEFFANAEDTELLVGLAGPQEQEALIEEWANALKTELPELRGLAFETLSRTSARTSGSESRPHITPSQGGRTISVVYGVGHLTYRTAVASYRVSAGSFFQVNRHMTDELVSIVTNGLEGRMALDLYAGVGLFSSVLARSIHHIEAVESSQSSFADLKYNSPANVKVVCATVEQYLQNAARKLAPDVVVVDPPRAGLGERVASQLGKLEARRITYVSCDPAILARDLKYLLVAGYRVEQAHLVDLFPQTFHMETVLHLAR
jgi:23S rRNA (uracil1939-C5)-methyltransferase